MVFPEFEVLHSQFGFILKQTEENNYTASVKVLTDSDVSQMPQSLGQSEAMFMNASTFAPNNEWHKAVARVSEGEVAVEVYNNTGTLLKNMTKSTANTGFGELGITMTYAAGQVVAFKNLKVEAVSQTPKPTRSEPVQESGIDFLYPYIRMALLLAGTGVAVVFLKGRKGNSKHIDELGASSQSGCD